MFYLGIGDDPHLTFDVNSMIGTFNDASAIRQLVTSTLKSIVKKRFVLPNGSLFTLDKDLRFMRVI